MLDFIKAEIKKYRYRKGTAGLERAALLYHHVGEANVFDAKFHSVPFDKFREQIEFFRRRWRFVGEEEFFSTDRDNGKFKRAIVTFDDGYRDTLRYAIPYLEENRIPYVFFVNQQIIEHRFFWRDALRMITDRGLAGEFIERSEWLRGTEPNQLLRATKDRTDISSLDIARSANDFVRERAGETWAALESELYIDRAELLTLNEVNYGLVGNHTMTHPFLSSLDTEAEIREEIGGMQRYLATHLTEKRLSNSFSMPFGSEQSYNDQILDILTELGYQYVFVSSPSYYRSGEPTQFGAGDLVASRRLLPKADN